MSEYEAQIILESNGNKLVITAGSDTIANWPEEIVTELVKYLKSTNLLIKFIVTGEKVKK